MHNQRPSFFPQRPTMRTTITRIGLALLLTTSTQACGEDQAAGLPSNARDAVSTYADIVEASYEDSLAAAVSMDQAVVDFVEAPSEETLKKAREAWLAAREPYLQTEVFRFYNGPIDNPKDGPEGMLNAWPLDEAYIDYVEGDPNSGIINDPRQKISAGELEALNEQGGEKNIATGFHAVEFLLWGQDTDADGPGNRPVSDYVVGDSGSPQAERRGQYLKTVSKLITVHLEQVLGEWRSAEDTYRDEFESVAPEEALTRILTGMVVLTGFETGGERLQTSLDSGDQEDEHSCFSDNTHRDMIQDIRGVKNVWQGSYRRLNGNKVSGTSIEEVVRYASPELATELEAQIAASLEAANELVPPFDQEISLDNRAGRKRVQALIEALGEQETLLQDVFHLYGFSVRSTK